MKDKYRILNDVKVNIDEYEEVKFDNNDNIIEFLEMSGYTVFSRLKNKEDYTNLSIDSLHEKVSNKKLKLALENAKELLQNKKLECLEQ